MVRSGSLRRSAVSHAVLRGACVERRALYRRMTLYGITICFRIPLIQTSTLSKFAFYKRYHPVSTGQVYAENMGSWKSINGGFCKIRAPLASIEVNGSLFSDPNKCHGMYCRYWRLCQICVDIRVIPCSGVRREVRQWTAVHGILT